MSSGGRSHKHETDKSVWQRLTERSLPIGPAQENTGRLLELANNLLKRLSRLQVAEWRLFDIATKGRETPGRRAVRQIERERRRLGRDLHTGVGQLLAAIRLQLEIIQKQLSNPPASINEAIERTQMLVAKAHAEVRGLSKQLYAPEWQFLDLDAAIRQLWEITGVPQRFASSIETAPLPRQPSPEIKTLLYRATQEALSNITSHANASRIELGLMAEGDRLHLRIHDNGGGFDAADVFAGRGGIEAGIGLRSIRDQAADLGGSLRIQSSPQGTTVEVFAPFDPI